MRKLLAACLTIALAQGLALAQAPTPRPGSAADPNRFNRVIPIELTPPQMEFGDIRNGEVREGEISLKNTGDEPLKILDTRASCSCTLLDLESDVIEPGQSVKLKIAFKPSPELYGKVTRYSLVRIEGYPTPLRLMASANINDGVRIEREHEPLGQFDTGFLTLKSITGDPFRVISVAGNPVEYVGDPPADDAPQLEHVVRFDLTTWDRDDRRAWIAVETDHPTAPVVFVPIDGARSPAQGARRVPWLISETRISLGYLNPGEVRETTISLRSVPDPSLFERVRVLGAAPELDVEVISATPSEDNASMTNLKLRITVSPDATGIIHDPLQVRARRSDRTVDIMGRVRPAANDTSAEATETSNDQPEGS